MFISEKKWREIQAQIDTLQTELEDARVRIADVERDVGSHSHSLLRWRPDLYYAESHDVPEVVEAILDHLGMTLEKTAKQDAKTKLVKKQKPKT